MLEDRLLVWQLKRGGRDALRRIYEKYREGLLRMAAGLLRETRDAEDVVQDVFTQFIRDASRFTLTGSLRGYLTTCVANRARNLNRAITQRQTGCLDDHPPMVSRGRRPDEWIIHDEQSQQLCHALMRLPYEQREAVVLHVQGGLKFREIAAMQETSVKTTVSRYRYGIDKLRSLLNDKVTL